MVFGLLVAEGVVDGAGEVVEVEVEVADGGCGRTVAEEAADVFEASAVGRDLRHQCRTTLPLRNVRPTGRGHGAGRADAKSG